MSKLVLHITGTPEQIAEVRAFCKGARIPTSHPRNPEEYLCKDCGGPSNSFMVHDHVWKQAGFKYKDNSCLRCLEIRLGRKLMKSDFPDLPINKLALHSYEV